MKFLFFVSVLILFIPLMAEESFIPEKTKKTSLNALKSIQELKRHVSLVEANKDPEKDPDLLLNVFKSISCMQAYAEEMDGETMQSSLGSLAKNPGIEEKLKKTMSDKNFLMKMMPMREQIMSDPKSLCTFTIEKTADELKKEKLEKDKSKKAFLSIQGLKKQVHPAWGKLITDLEKKEDKLRKAATTPIELKHGEFEQNFVKMFEFQNRYINSKALEKLSLMTSDCLTKIRAIFTSRCNGKPRYMLVRGQTSQLLLCADDHLGALDPKCNYSQTFTDKE